MTLSVCLSIRIFTSELYQFSAHTLPLAMVGSSSGGVAIRYVYDCTSGFLDDVMFSHMTDFKYEEDHTMSYSTDDRLLSTGRSNYKGHVNHTSIFGDPNHIFGKGETSKFDVKWMVTSRSASIL